jgi:hypothetical protein
MAKPITATSALPADIRKPVSIDICETSSKAFQMAAALVRIGYTFVPDRPVDVYQNGTAAFTVVLGQPTETGYEDAQVAMRAALEVEQAEFERRVQAEVKLRVEQLQRQEMERQVAEAEAAQAAAIARIKAEADARIAALQSSK